MTFSLSDNFDLLQTPATRSSMFGRGSGGIATFSSPKSDPKMIVKKRNWIISRHKTEIPLVHLIVANVYIPPYKSFDDALIDLQVDLETVIESFPSDLVVVGGDFNARVGDLGDIANAGESIGIPTERTGHDKKITKRGRALMKLMTELNLILLNGRLCPDIPSNFTFISSTGKSTIDLIFCNENTIPFVTKLEVGESEFTGHFPVQVKFSSPPPLKATAAEHPQWKQESHLLYQQCVRDKLITHPIPTTITDFMTVIKSSAKEAGMWSNGRREYQNPKWFDSDCKNESRSVKSALKTAKASGWATKDRDHYLEMKKRLNNFFNLKKANHRSQIKSRLSDSHSQSDFYKTVGLLRRRRTIPCPITLETWKNFYEESMPAPSEDPLHVIADATHPTLDTPITSSELNAVLRQLKPKKAAGPDQISNEFFKYLPDEAKDLLLQQFNLILDKETPPHDWSQSTTVVLYKKGNPLDPLNYRPICLANAIGKIFCKILSNRLTKWAFDTTALPESQGGFRQGRGCLEQIFTLHAVTQLGTLDKKKVFALFIDFKQAFPSLDHKLLWTRLHDLGLSGKFIRLLQFLYQNAHTQISTREGLSSPIRITKGILQGDPLSPILFNLFIANMAELFLRNRNSDGIRINTTTRLHLLQYADDTAILAPNVTDMTRKIQVLSEYFVRMGLEVNLAKTKIIIFRRGGRPPRVRFCYQGQSIEIVRSYVYLGVTFTSSTLFLDAVKVFKTKALAATASTWELLVKGKNDSILSALKLFDAIIASTLLYSSSVWGLRHQEQIESIQTQFLRRFLGLEFLTANYALRLETNRVHLRFRIIHQALNFWQRLLQMTSDRLPKMCYDALVQMDTTSPDATYNWVTQFKENVASLGMSDVWNSQDSTLLPRKRLLLESFRTQSVTEDQTRLAKSTRYTFYSTIAPINDLPLYLTSSISLPDKRNIAEVRLNSHFLKFDSTFILLKANGMCPVCNLRHPDTVTHLLCECPHTKRPTFSSWIADSNVSPLTRLLQLFQYPPPGVSFNSLAQEMRQSLRQRKVLEEFQNDVTLD